MAISMTAFWFALVTIFYTYFGFPILVALVGVIRNRVVAKKSITPSVSLIIAAYNEEDNIGRTLENVLALDYPEDQLEIIIASDGSTDSTESIVNGYAARGVRLLSLPRKGKIWALVSAIEASSGEVVVFCDANTHLDEKVLRTITANFSDPTVGGVCGNQKHLKQAGTDHSPKGEQLYWKYDKWLKSLESRTGSIVSADGAIYAIRSRLFEAPPVSSAVTDDFFISTGVVAQGYRLVYEEMAVATEPPSVNAKKEFSRKVRIINRGLRGVFLRRTLLNPFRFGFYSIILLSHKVLRRLVPFMLILLAGASLWLIDQGAFYLAAVVSQGFFYTLALAGYLLRSVPMGGWKVFYIPFFYCLANSAALVAVLRIFSGESIRLWEPAR